MALSEMQNDGQNARVTCAVACQLLCLSLTLEHRCVLFTEHELLLDHDSQGKGLILKTSDDPVQVGRVLEDIDRNAGGSETEFLFLPTLVDIDERVAKGGRYNLIRAAGLLRQLLLDLFCTK
jgi:hypothetical protein